MSAFSWRQGEEESDLTLSITVPVILPPSASWKEVEVSLPEADILRVQWRSTIILQWRLHDDIHELSWTVENGELVIDAMKKDTSIWVALLKKGMIPTDRIMLTDDKLDALLATELLPLPPVKAAAADGAASTGAAAAEGESAAAAVGEDDLDRLLDETLDLQVSHPKNAALSAMVEQEARDFAEEIEKFKAKQAEFEAELETAETDAAKADAAKKIQIVTRMLELNDEIRKLRSEVPNFEIFRRIQDADIFKSRLNSGNMEEVEQEAFSDEQEAECTPHNLLQIAMELLKRDNIGGALHFLRLNAIHHNHPVSTVLLHRLYSDMRLLAKAAYFVLRRANMEDCDVATNMLTAELFDRGQRHFPPLMACAVRYYQRAALSGASHAMLTLAQIFSNGGCSASVADEAVREGNKDIGRFHSWLKEALDRGNTDAYFIQATLHITGEHGVEKSYVNAKKWMDMAKKSNPSKMRRAGAAIDVRLEKLKEEDIAAGKYVVSSPTSSSEPSMSRTGSADLKSAAAKSPTTPSASTGSVRKVGDESKPPAAAASRAAAPAPAAKPSSQQVALSGRPAAATTAATGASRVRDLERAAPATAISGRAGGGMLRSAVSSAKWRIFWEKLVRWYATAYFFYALAFPVRILLAPQFFAAVAFLKEAAGGFGSSSNRGML